MTGFHRYLIQRFLASVIALIGVSIIVFLMVRLLPGDPARIIAGLLASEEDVALIRRQLGLSQPFHVQYGMFLTHALRGDLGRSARTSEPVIREVLTRL